MKLELGGGNFPREGYVSIDRRMFTPNTIVHDLENGLPVEEIRKQGPVERIVADNVLEHITNLIQLMNDCYDVLVSGGEFEIIVPLAGTAGSWKDPTHVRHFIPESFDFFDLKWDYPRQPDYGIKKWHVESIELVKQNEDYQYLHALLRKP